MSPLIQSALPTPQATGETATSPLALARPRRRSVRHALGLAAVTTVTALALTVVSASTASAIAVPVGLGTADSFAVLASSGVTNTGPTVINGDLGTFPDTSITGPGSITVNGTNHEGDLVTQSAKLDLVTAYTAAAGQGPTQPITADLASQVLFPDVYNSASTLALSGELTLDAQGNADAVWVFQAGSDLIVGPSASVTLINGAQACNVYWQVGSSASLDTGVAFKGTIMALASITVNTGSTIQGRLLAQTGTVTLDTNTITRPACTGGSGAARDGGVAAAGGGSGGLPSGNIDTGDGSAALDAASAEGPAQSTTVRNAMTVFAVLTFGGLVTTGALVTATRRTPRRKAGL